MSNFKVAPSIKASSGSGGGQRPRTIIGSFVGFANENNTAVIQIIAPGSEMNGKMAHISYADLPAEKAGKRTPIHVRVPGKTESVPDPMNRGKTIQVPLKTDWNKGMVVRFEGALFSGEGKGGENDPYQMTATWGNTFSPLAERTVAIESGYVRKFDGRDGSDDKYRMIVTYVDQSQVVSAADVAAMADSVAEQVKASVEAGATQNFGLTVVAFDKEGNGDVVPVNSFISVNGDAVEVAPGHQTLAEAAKKAGVDLSAADKVLVIPQLTMNATGVKWMDERQVNDWDYLAKRSKDEQNNFVNHSFVVAMSPDHRYVGAASMMGGKKNFIEQAMIHTGLMEKPEQTKGQESMPEPEHDNTSGPQVDHYND